MSSSNPRGHLSFIQVHVREYEYGSTSSFALWRCPKSNKLGAGGVLSRGRACIGTPRLAAPEEAPACAPARRLPSNIGNDNDNDSEIICDYSNTNNANNDDNNDDENDNANNI